ncbi:MAG: DUF1553 domain-containing protein [Opitutus sp.]|nr:DUF1553 domain-containing protein [Opitutus sp.]
MKSGPLCFSWFVVPASAGSEEFCPACRRANLLTWLFALMALATVLRAAEPTLKSTLAALAPADLQFFENKIRPLLSEQCYNCHSKGADKIKGGLLLDTREAWQSGGNSGPVIVPGKPDESPLIEAIRYKNEDLQMPPKGEKLSDQQIADLTEWVRRGAPDPRTLVSKGSSASYGGVGKAHWSFQLVKKPAVPAVQNAAWPQNPVDNFVLAKLEANGMAPNASADRMTLIRRVTFDLIGLPPSVSDVQAFLDEKSPDAYAKVVDRLLASPFYGEHWGRYWLDVARFSDTKGDAPKQDDVRYPHAWTYRDWVIGALNADIPYNQFIFEQLAGDRLQAVAAKKAKDKGQPPPNRQGLAALGFLTLGNTFDGRRDDIIADQIDVTCKAFLGLTVSCARCHDHKFDPIPTKDYYSLYGVFANSQQPATLPTFLAAPEKTPEYLSYLAKSAELTKREEAIKAELLALRRAGRGKPDPTKRRELIRKERELQREIGDLESNDPGTPPRANALYDVPLSRDYPVLLRGEVANKGDSVPRRFLEILSPDPKKRPEWHNGSGRVELATAIVDPRNPLTARVLVNRLWQQHWGEGFVSTPDDLGNMSAPPSNPELLDWLAATFVADGWSQKKLHRMIVLSAAYQQSARTNPEYAERDPNNKLLWRYNLRRLDFEQMHDALLAITGELDPTMGGKPVPISSEGFARRRAIYTVIDRRNLPELLTQFDFPSPDVESGRRYETIVPQQALFLMNSPMVVEAARKLVDHAGFAALKSDEARVKALYITIYQRLPTAQEVALGARYVKANPAGTAIQTIDSLPPAAREARITVRKAKQLKNQGKFSNQVGGVYDTAIPPDAWTKLAHALFQSNEAMFYQ